MIMEQSEILPSFVRNSRVIFNGVFLCCGVKLNMKLRKVAGGDYVKT
jgi:hypothetical protein